MLPATFRVETGQQIVRAFLVPLPVFHMNPSTCHHKSPQTSVPASWDDLGRLDRQYRHP